MVSWKPPPQNYNLKNPSKSKQRVQPRAWNHFTNFTMDLTQTFWLYCLSKKVAIIPNRRLPLEMIYANRGVHNGKLFLVSPEFWVPKKCNSVETLLWCVSGVVLIFAGDNAGWLVFCFNLMSFGFWWVVKKSLLQEWLWRLFYAKAVFNCF